MMARSWIAPVLLIAASGGVVALLVGLSATAPTEAISSAGSLPTIGAADPAAAPGPAGPGGGALIGRGGGPAPAMDGGGGRKVDGLAVWEIHGCMACHDMDQPMMGPPVRGAWGSVRTLQDGRQVIVDEAYIRRSILDPQADLVEGYPDQMVSQEGQITDEEIAAIVELYRAMAGSK
jgi:hypothetical protein